MEIFESATNRRVLFTEEAVEIWYEQRLKFWRGLGNAPLQFTKIFGNFFGNSEVKMSLNVEDGIC